MKMLFILILSFTSSAVLAVDCTSLWGSGFPAQGHTRTSFDCHKVETGSERVKLFYAQDLSSTPNLSEMIEAIKASLLRSYSSYQSLGDMPKVKTVLYHHPSYQDSEGDYTFAAAITDFPRVMENFVLKQLVAM